MTLAITSAEVARDRFVAGLVPFVDCVECHTVRQTEPRKGGQPQLGSARLLKWLSVVIAEDLPEPGRARLTEILACGRCQRGGRRLPPTPTENARQ